MRFRREERGAVAAEYALILMVVALACVFGLTTLGSGISNGINAIANSLTPVIAHGDHGD